VRVGDGLAVLGGDDRGELVGVRDQEMTEREEDRGALDSDESRHVSEALRAMATTWSTRPASATGTVAVTWPVDDRRPESRPPHSIVGR